MADGNFDLSAVMRFDGKQAAAGADETATAIKEIAKANREVAASAREAASAGGKKGDQPDGAEAKREAQAQREAAAAAKEKARADKEAAAAAKKLADEEAALDRELQKVRDSLDPTAAAQRRLNRELDIAATGFARGKLSAAEYDEAVKRLTNGQRASGKEADAAAKALNRNAFGARNLGQQVGDFATQVSLGGGFIRAFSSQAGQVGFALSEMGGKAGAVGAFLTGPWGIALTVGALVLAPFVEELFKASEGLAKVELGSSGLADSQGALGEIFDLVTGKLKSQNTELAASNELLRINARLTAINLRVEAAKEAQASKKALDDVGNISASDRVRGALTNSGGGAGIVGLGLGALSGTERGNQNAVNLRRVVDDLRAGRTTREAALKASAKIDFTGLKVSQQEFQGAIRDAVSSEAKNTIADLVDKALDTGNLPGGLRRTGSSAKPKKPPKPKSTEAVDEFGRDAADKIAALRDQLSDTPPVVAAVNKQLAQLDDLIDDIGRKKPPGFEKLIADATALRPLVEAGLNKPYRDYLEAQENGLAIQRLVTAGKVDEAAALKVVQGLQREMGPLTVEQRDAVLATVQALRLEQREADILRDKQQQYLTALGSIKTAVRGVIFDGVGGLEALPGRLVNAFSTLKGEQLFDKLFDGAFRDLEDQAKGTTVVRDASDRMAAAVEKARTSTGKLGAAFDGLTAKVNGSAIPGAGGIATASFVGSDGKFDAKSFGELLKQTPSAPDPLAPSGDGGEIVIKGKRTGKSPTDFFGGAIERLTRGVGIGSSAQDRERDVAEALKNGVQIKDDAAAKIGKFSGKAIQGAATGAFANSIFAPLAKGLGLRTSKTGAQVGGAIGGLTGIPGGDIIGSIAGSIIGGLFKGKVKAGGATVTGNADGSFTTGATGSNKAGIATGTGLTGSITSGLSQIAQQLGGALGAFNVSIGTYKGDLRVNENGKALGGVKNSGAFGFGTDEQAAVSKAIQLAIAQGAVTGLSAAVQKAISSNANVDKALSEATGVKALEQLLGGLTGSLKAAFDAEDAAGKERVRLARTYGLDIIATEKLNAEQRSKLLADTLESRLGGLTSFSSSLKFGDLAEGSPTEKLAALQIQIDKVQKQAEAGVDGAADTLAGLLSQKVSQARDAFGTAGPEYTSARTDSISAVDRVIKMETDRINAAAGIAAAQVASIEKVATLTNETNDILAQVLAAVRSNGTGSPVTSGAASFTTGRSLAAV